MRQPFDAMLIISVMVKVGKGRFGAIVVCAAMAACSAGSAPARKAEVAEGSAAMESRIEGLAEGQRNGVFLRAIRDSRQECQHVERSERAGEHHGLPIWRAWCEGGASYTIVISRSGSAQVIADSDIRLGHEAPPKEGGRGQ